jgi:hypothetical protein
VCLEQCLAVYFIEKNADLRSGASDLPADRSWQKKKESTKLGPTFTKFRKIHICPDKFKKLFFNNFD